MDELTKRRRQSSAAQKRGEATSTPCIAGDEALDQKNATPRIFLIDADHPDEPLEVEVEGANATTLRVAVPNTFVKFELRRYDNGAAYQGSLGGRYFMFVPRAKTVK